MAAPMHNMTRLPSASVPSAPFDGGVFRFKDDEVRFSTRGDDRLMTIVSATRRHAHLPRHARHRRPLSRRLRRRRGGRHATRKTRARLAGDVVHRHAGVALQGLLGDGARASRPAAGRRLEQDLHLLPQHDPLLRRRARRARGSEDRAVPGRGRRSAACRPSGARATRSPTPRRCIAPSPTSCACSARAASGAGAGRSAARHARALRRRARSSRSASAASRATAAASSTCSTTRPSRRTSRARAFLRVSAPVAGERASAARRRHQPRLRALPSGAVHALRLDLGGTRAQRRAARRQQHQQRRGARLSARRLRVGDGVQRLPRSARAQSPARGRARGARRRRLHALPRRSTTTAEAQRAHTHHDPAGAGGRCLGCHMPQKNMSLDNRLGRYHRIASPTETAKVEGDRPLECALCHGDKPVETPGGDDGDVVAQALRPRAAARALRRRSDARRSARRDAGARQAARAGGGADARSARAATSRWRRWWPRS